jgi:cytoskeletal protein RodZ
MRLVWGITIAVCLGFPAWGVVCQQQETPGPANATAQAPASAPQNESPPEQKKETPAAPAETKTEPKTESQQTEPQIPPKTEAQPDEVKPEQTKKADVAPTPATVKRHSTRRRAAPTAANGRPRKVVVREGGADEPTAQILTGMAPEEATRKRQDAEQLLKATDATVKRAAPGPVDVQRQETVSQIHNYMQGARSALKEGDISRGHTLALKASLLAEDLARH